MRAEPSWIDHTTVICVGGPGPLTMSLGTPPVGGRRPSAHRRLARGSSQPRNIESGDDTANPPTVLERYTPEVSSRPQSGSARRKGDLEPRQEPPAVPVPQRSRPSQRPLGPLDRIPARPQPTGPNAAHIEPTAFPVEDIEGVPPASLPSFMRAPNFVPSFPRPIWDDVRPRTWRRTVCPSGPTPRRRCRAPPSNEWLMLNLE